ncbi:ABC transporter permease [Chloroflexota bacterium]
MQALFQADQAADKVTGRQRTMAGILFGCAVVLLVAFLFLPWFTLPASETVEAATFTGLNLLTNPVPFLYNFALWFVPVAGMLALLVTGWGLRTQTGIRIVFSLAIVFGALSILYHVLLFFRFGQGDVDPTVGWGVWLSFLAGLALLAVGTVALWPNLLGTDPVVALAPLVATLLALFVGGFVLLALGKNPIEAYGAMLDGAFGSQRALFRTLTRATPLLLVAIGICIAFRGGMINIGAEGQLFVGAIAASACSIALGGRLPGWLLVVLTLLVGTLGGAFWGLIPGVLKARFDVNEILSTVMLNEIAVQLVIFLLAGPMIDPEQVRMGTRVPQSSALPEEVWLGRLAPPSQIHTGLFIAIGMAILVYVLLWRTTTGYRIRAVGQNQDAARYAGIKVPRFLALSLILSGAMAGMAGAVEVMGVSHRMVEGFAVGYGFSGIVVALFGRLHPIGAIPSAILFGALLVGADKMQRTVQIPSATIIALQGLIVIFVVSSDFWVRRRQIIRQSAPVEVSTDPPTAPPAQEVVA